MADWLAAKHTDMKTWHNVFFMKIQAITFDAGGTLIEPWPSVGHVYAEVANRHGKEVSPEELNRRFISAWRKRKNFDYSSQAWARLVDEVFSDLTTEPPSRTFFDELYERFAQADTWRVFDDVEPTLKALHERGIRLAVLSNWDERLRPLLEELELGQWFEEVYISLEIGWAKPDERIFEVAAKGLGLARDEILHAGDSLKEDVRGALNTGWQSRHLVRGTGNNLGSEAPTITSLTELIEMGQFPH